MADRAVQTNSKHHSPVRQQRLTGAAPARQITDAAGVAPAGIDPHCARVADVACAVKREGPPSAMFSRLIDPGRQVLRYYLRLNDGPGVESVAHHGTMPTAVSPDFTHELRRRAAGAA